MNQQPIYRYAQKVINDLYESAPSEYWIPLMCSNGLRHAKYKLFKIVETRIKNEVMIVYKLDKRSIRYAKGVKFIGK